MPSILARSLIRDVPAPAPVGEPASNRSTATAVETVLVIPCSPKALAHQALLPKACTRKASHSEKPSAKRVPSGRAEQAVDRNTKNFGRADRDELDTAPLLPGQADFAGRLPPINHDCPGLD